MEERHTVIDKMPLAWNIEGTEMGNIRDTKSESSDNCPDIFISAVGLSVLNKIGEGYNPTLQTFELDEKTMSEIKSEWLKDSKSEQEVEEINNWLPKLVGANFRRAG